MQVYELHDAMEFSGKQLTNDRVQIIGEINNESDFIRERFESVWASTLQAFGTQPISTHTDAAQVNAAKTEEKSAPRIPFAGLNSEAIQLIAKNTTGVQASPEYDTLSVKELKHKAARFDALRYGNIDNQEVDAAKPEKKNAKPRKAKGKIPTMPKRKADAYKWVLAWEKIEPKIQEDATLKIDYDELRTYLKAFSLTFRGNDTLRKIIKCGDARKIPTREEFERKNQM